MCSTHPVLCSVVWGIIFGVYLAHSTFYVTGLLRTMDVRMTLLPSKTALFWYTSAPRALPASLSTGLRGKQINIGIVLALRSVEFMVDLTDDWAALMEIHLIFVGGCWVTHLPAPITLTVAYQFISAILLAVERRAGVTEHGTGLQVFTGVAVLVQVSRYLI